MRFENYNPYNSGDKEYMMKLRALSVTIMNELDKLRQFENSDVNQKNTNFADQSLSRREDLFGLFHEASCHFSEILIIERQVSGDELVRMSDNFVFVIDNEIGEVPLNWEEAKNDLRYESSNLNKAIDLLCKKTARLKFIS